MKKLSAVPKKLYYFFLLILLLIVIVVFIQLGSNFRIRNRYAAEQQIAKLRENTEIINALHHKMLSSMLYGKYEGQEMYAIASKEIETALLKLSQSGTQLSGNRLFKRQKDILKWIDSYNKNLSGFSKANADVMTSLKERGNLFEGIIASWFGQVKDIEAGIGNGNQNLLTGLEKIKGLQSEYIMTSNSNLIESLNALVMTLQTQIPPDDLVSSGKFDILLQLSAKLNTIDNRLGLANGQGELLAYDEAYAGLNNTLDSFSQVTKKYLHRSVVIIHILTYLFIFLLSSLFLVLAFRLIDRTTLLPVNSIRNYVTELSKGILPERPPKIDSADIPGGIAEELNTLARGLKAKIHFARELNRGEINTEMDLLSSRDELGIEMKKIQNSIISSAEEQSRYNEDNARRRYINEGLANFGNILRLNSSNLTNLGDYFIRELVKYLNAIQGGFFILDDSEKDRPVLKLLAAFAYNRKKYIEKTIQIGEGLVGTCAIEKKTIHLTEIPKDYILITSGLGDTPPDNLLLIPVKHEEELIGVLEIASLNSFKDHEIAFAEEIAGNLGSTIITTRTNQRTSELLEKSQQQAFEMAEQEEEMRQNMEELKATQEESARREEEFSGIVTSLNQSVFIIEYEIDGIISSVNEKFLIFINKRSEDLIGKTHASLFGADTPVDSKFWNQFTNLSNTCLYEKITIGKKDYVLKEHFAIISNRDGLPVKIMNILTDISEHSSIKK
jgi:PAS domain-containing protein